MGSLTTLAQLQIITNRETYLQGKQLSFHVDKVEEIFSEMYLGKPEVVI
jgi:hypothetical protein